MKSIFKYPLKVTDTQKISIPNSGEILSLQVQNNIPCIWVLIHDLNDKDKTTECVINMYGTGHTFEENGFCEFLGTFQLKEGLLVFHVFRELDV